jgi:hypothetical protein
MVTSWNDAGHNQSVDVSYFAQTPDGQRRKGASWAGSEEALRKPYSAFAPVSGPARGMRRKRKALSLVTAVTSTGNRSG